MCLLPFLSSVSVIAGSGLGGSSVSGACSIWLVLSLSVLDTLAWRQQEVLLAVEEK